MNFDDIEKIFKLLKNTLGINLPSWLIGTVILIMLFGVFIFLLFKLYNNIPPSISNYIDKIIQAKNTNKRIETILRNLTPDQISGINELVKNKQMYVIKYPNNSYDRNWVPFFIDNKLINHNDEKNTHIGVECRISLKTEIIKMVKKCKIITNKLEI